MHTMWAIVEENPVPYILIPTVNNPIITPLFRVFQGQTEDNLYLDDDPVDIEAPNKP